MLGFKKTDSVYQHVLDGFVAMMEYQYDQVTDETNTKSSTVQDILITELGKAKQEADIIVPSNTFKENVNRKIECKE
jgi:galactitol-specific phosphotransferase system IIB component